MPVTNENIYNNPDTLTVNTNPSKPDTYHG